MGCTLSGLSTWEATASSRGGMTHIEVTPIGAADPKAYISGVQGLTTG